MSIDGTVTISICDYESLKENIKTLEYLERCVAPIDLHENEPERWTQHQEKNYTIKRLSSVDLHDLVVRMKLKLEERK